jgi:hypothetical protein
LLDFGDKEALQLYWSSLLIHSDFLQIRVDKARLLIEDKMAKLKPLAALLLAAGFSAMTASAALADAEFERFIEKMWPRA